MVTSRYPGAEAPGKPRRPFGPSAGHSVTGFRSQMLFDRFDDQLIEILHPYHGKQDVEWRLGDEAGGDE